MMQWENVVDFSNRDDCIHSFLLGVQQYTKQSADIALLCLKRKKGEAAMCSFV